MSRRIDDGNNTTILVTSGSVGNSYVSMSFENTASLGLSESIAIISASVGEVLNDTTSSYAFEHMERTVKFVAAKMYDNREAIAEVWTGDQRIYGNKNFVNPITGSVDKLSTARTIGGVSFDGSRDINLPGVNTAGNQNTTGRATTAVTAQTALALSGWTFEYNSKKGTMTITPVDGKHSFTISAEDG